MNLIGKVVKILPTQVVSDKFSKRELWLEVPDGNYPQTLSIEFVNAKTGDLDGFSEGDKVDVAINLRGRIAKDKCYNTIQGWKITGLTAATQPAGVDEDPNDIPF